MKSYTTKILSQNFPTVSPINTHQSLICNDICNILNNYFVNIGTTLANSIPDYINLTSSFLCNRSRNSNFLKDTDPEEIS